MANAFGSPVLIVNESNAKQVSRIQLGSNFYDERWLQELLFKHPDCLPTQEIDRSFSNLIPICMELSTGAGPIDALYVTPEGKLVIAEAKLWRNPEARRKVIGQVLDYAKELSSWRYEDLQREVSKRLKRTGNSLFAIAAEKHPELNEASFVDEVNRTLEMGEFMLLLVGDGIRSDAAAIADYIERSGTLNFTFGLIEAAIFDMENGSYLVQPRILTKTVVIERTLVQLVDGQLVVVDDLEGDAQVDENALEEKRQFWLSFWADYVDSFSIDDPVQKVANPARQSHIYWDLTSGIWITNYVSLSSDSIGVFLGIPKRNLGDDFFEYLRDRREEIEDELSGYSAKFDWDLDVGARRHPASVQITFSGDINDTVSREKVFSQLAPVTNAFINTFSHRVRSYADQLGKS